MALVSRILTVIALCGLASSARADDQALLDRALATALAQAERALPDLAASGFGVDVTAYHAALRQQPFLSAAWGGEIQIVLQIRTEPTALAQAERALPDLAASAFGVDVAAYHAALRQRPFLSSAWGGEIQIALQIRAEPTGSCGRYAAFVRMPPEAGVLPLVLCPQFFTPGADALRVLTILHEMVHVVAGRDECQAMAFAARVEQLSTGSFTPVDAYWAASNCPRSGYRLP